jgi:hypothetical protein
MGRARGLSWAFATLVGLAALLMLAPIASAAGAGSISGTVVHHVGGAPFEGTDVTVFTASHEFVTSVATRTGGKYEATGLTAGSYVVEFFPPSKSIYAPQFYKEAPSFASATTVPVTEGKVTTEINGSLREGGMISGKVTDEHGSPVAKVTVVAVVENAEFSSEGETGAGGEYSIEGLPEGAYKVVFIPAEEANLVPQYYKDRSSAGTAETIDVKEELTVSPVNATLAQGGEITGQATDAVTHKPVSGAVVVASNALGPEFFGSEFAITNGNGEYTIFGLGNGSYNLEFFAEESSNEYIEQSDNGIGVTQGSTTSGVNVALVPKAPNNTSSPTASGTPAVGQTLSCSNGSWSGISPISYTYKWLRDGSTIEGATGSSYTVQSADQGHGVACEVTATNSKGHSSAKSNTLSVPLPPPPPPPPPVPSVALASAKVIVTGDVARVPIHCNAATCTGTIELIQQIVTKHHRGHRTITRKLTIVLGKAPYTLAAGQTRLLLVHLSKSGKHRLDATRHHELSIALVVSVQGGSQLRQPVLLAQARVKRK